MATVARVALAVLLTFLASGLTLTQAAGESARASIVRVDTSEPPWRDVYISVADSRGLPVTGLERAAFHVTEDGVDVPIDRVATATESQVPIALGLVMDVSGSMSDAGKLDAAKQAASQVVASLGPADSAAIISFGDKAEVVQGMTADKDALNAAINSLSASGNTALYDAIVKTTLLSEALPQPFKVQLLITDGMDTTSTAKLKDVLDSIGASGSLMYPIGIGGDVDRSVLDQLAQAGNGQAAYTDDPSELASDFETVLDRLRLTYVVRYRTPATAASDQEHRVAANISYQGQVAQAVSAFTPAASAVTVDLGGVAAGETVTGDRQIAATVRSGRAQRVDLLLDGTTLASSNGQPSNLIADLSGLSPGDHDLVVRAADAVGNLTVQHVPFTVRAAAAPAAVATPAPPPQPEPEVSAESGPRAWLLWVYVLLVLAAGALYMWWRSRLIQPVPGGLAAAGADDDTTLDLAPPEDGLAPVREHRMLRIDSQGQQRDVMLGDDPVSIGRDADNTVVLRDAHVSRHHARVALQDDQYWIEDLKSQNGTLLNGQVAIERRQLEPGDQFTIGSAALTYLAPTTSSGSDGGATATAQAPAPAAMVANGR